jgi:hypothetical protein
MGWAAVAMTGISSVRSVLAGNKAAKASRAQAKYQADLMRQTAQYNADTERLRLAREEQLSYEANQRQSGAIRAAALASGFEMAGSPMLYLQESQRLYAEDLSWKRRMSERTIEGMMWEAETNADLAVWKGKITAQQQQSAGWSQAISNVGSMFASLPSSTWNFGKEAPAVTGQDFGLKLEPSQSGFGLSMSRGSGFGLNTSGVGDWWSR